MNRFLAVTMLAISAAAPRPAGAQPLCVDVQLWTIAVNQPVHHCEPYSGSITCVTRGADGGALAAVLVTVCVPKVREPRRPVGSL